MRNNESRTGANPSADSTAALEASKPESKMASPLEFVTPTDFVELPSRGKGYPEGHPLKGKEVIEIKFMTAKEEDILTSQALLKKNLALERFLESVILDKSINPKDMLVGDRNAVLISARASGYGDSYDTKVSCPNCGVKSDQSFNLKTPQIHHGGSDALDNVTETANGTFIVTVPLSKFKVEIKCMTGHDETYIASIMTSNKKHRMPETNMSIQYERMVVSVEGHTDPRVIKHFLKEAPARDTRAIRSAYKAIAPDVNIVKHFECPSCGHEQELEVPFGADFFWPDR